ncbi:PKD domain-containing protein [Jiulongibacter sp. NS-SX5]|uniref:PKD domain-containing protein n=1 Tax=Jiulongibacter sp. NS-SX5 TaxID=3463854 RepID=UPI004059F765
MRKLLLLFSLLFISESISLKAQSYNENYIPPVEEADVVGDDFYLQTNGFEMGIGPNGTFIGRESAPVGYHDQYYPQISFMVDFNKDGWDNGVPSRSGDYFMPGTPFEGFSVTFNGVNYSNRSFSDYQISGSNYTLADNIDQKIAVWIGSVPGLFEIKQTVTASVSELTFKLDVEIKNISGAEADIYYMRIMDPDQEYNMTSDYYTVNKVKKQIINHDDVSLVTAEGNMYGIYLGLMSDDVRSRCFWASNWYGHPKDLYEGNGSNLSGEIYQDYAIGIAFHENSLTNGETTVFSMNYLFDSGLEDILECDNPITVIAEIDTKNAICDGSNGSARIIELTGGEQPYMFNWANGAYTSNNFIKGMPSGDYILTVRDSNGCTDKIDYSIGRTEIEYEVSLELSKQICDVPGKARAIATGGATPHEYNWGLGFTDSDSIHLNKGTYDLIVRDSLGCQSFQSFSIEDTVINIEATFDISESTCGQDNGSVTVWASGGFEPYSFDFGSGFSDLNYYTSDSGLFKVQILDLKGCKDTLEFFIGDITPKPDFTFTSNYEDYTFFNESENYTSVFWNFGSTPLANSTKQEITSSDLPVSVSYTQEGTYTVNLMAFYGEGCFRTISKNINVEFCPDIVEINKLEDYEGENEIVADKHIILRSYLENTAELILNAKQYILMEPGTSISSGSVLSTNNEGCPNNE